VNFNYGNLFYYSRDFARLLKQSTRLHEINPALPFSTNHKALALAYLGRGTEAVAVMETANPMQGSDPLSIRIWAEILAVGGNKARAREALGRLISLTQQAGAPASYPAMIYAALGQPDRACDYLEKALEQRDTNLIVIDVAPPYDSLRKNPRFLAIRAKVFKETKATD
jgi:tetratricopeptide (TPR) repeat protein